MAPSGKRAMDPNASSFNPSASSFIPPRSSIRSAPTPDQTWYPIPPLPQVKYCDKKERLPGPESFNLWLLTPTRAKIQYFPLPEGASPYDFRPKTTFSTTIVNYRDNDAVKATLLTTLLQGQLEWRQQVDYPFCLTITHYRNYTPDGELSKDDVYFEWVYRLIRNLLIDTEIGRTPDWLAQTLAEDAHTQVKKPLNFQQLKLWMSMQRPAILGYPVARTKFAFFDVWNLVDWRKAGLFTETVVSRVARTDERFPYPSMRDPMPERTARGEGISYPHPKNMAMVSQAHAVLQMPKWIKDAGIDVVEDLVRSMHEERTVSLDWMAEAERGSWDYLTRYTFSSEIFENPEKMADAFQEVVKRATPRKREVTGSMFTKRLKVYSLPKGAPLPLLTDDAEEALEYLTVLFREPRTWACESGDVESDVVGSPGTEEEELPKVRRADSVSDTTPQDAAKNNDAPADADKGTSTFLLSPKLAITDEPPTADPSQPGPSRTRAVPPTQPRDEKDDGDELYQASTPRPSRPDEKDDDDELYRTSTPRLSRAVEQTPPAQTETETEPTPEERMKAKELWRRNLYAEINFKRVAAGHTPLGSKPPPQKEGKTVWCPKRKTYVSEDLLLSESVVRCRRAREAREAEEARQREAVLPPWLRGGCGRESREERWKRHELAGKRKEERRCKEIVFRRIDW